MSNHSSDDRKDHHHPHKHEPVCEDHDDLSLLERAVTGLLLEKGMLDAGLLRNQLDMIESQGPMLGAQLVARAWTDPSFDDLLVRDPRAAAEGCLGVTLPNAPEIAVLRNTEQLHHVVVCTLCSCYPKALLGLPPDWYKSFAYRARMVVDPRSVLKQFGTIIAPEVQIRVVDSTADLRYLVLPLRPALTDGWSEGDLLKLITRDSMIGVAIPVVDR